MKKIFILLIFLLSLTFSKKAFSQEQELQQLALNIEKLNQFRAILDNMYKGYTILSKGYNTIKDLSHGNFNLHKVFLDGLLSVSPAVRKYKKIADIISYQKNIVKEYKAAFNGLKNLNIFSAGDLEYMQSVYQNLFNRSLKNLDELLMVITANQLRMNDAQRLNAIDRIHADMLDKLEFLRYFNNNAAVLAEQKKSELKDIKTFKDIYGLSK